MFRNMQVSDGNVVDPALDVTDNTEILLVNSSLRLHTWSKNIEYSNYPSYVGGNLDKARVAGATWPRRAKGLQPIGGSGTTSAPNCVLTKICNFDHWKSRDPPVPMRSSTTANDLSQRLDSQYLGAETRLLLLLRLQYGLLSGIFHWHKGSSLSHSSVGGAEARATHFQRWRQRLTLPNGFIIALSSWFSHEKNAPLNHKWLMKHRSKAQPTQHSIRIDPATSEVFLRRSKARPFQKVRSESRSAVLPQKDFSGGARLF